MLCMFAGLFLIPWNFWIGLPLVALSGLAAMRWGA